jgi:hypothetical protein
LLELLLVLGTIVLMAGLAWPALRGSMAKSRLRDSAQQLRVELARTRLMAMENGVPLEFRYRSGEGRFRIVAREVAAATDGSPANARPGALHRARGIGGTGLGSAVAGITSEIIESQLPEGVVFAAASPLPLASEDPMADADFDDDDEERSLQSEGWSAPIVFLPDGTASNATVALRNGQGAQVVVQVRGVTGLAKSGEVESCDETEAPVSADEQPPLDTARERSDHLVR